MLLIDAAPGSLNKTYIKTVRNYSHLIDKKVLVKFKEGIAPDFVLDDIVPVE